MVTSSALSPWARVDIVIKKLDDPTQTKTLQFTNRVAPLGDATYLPLLKSYSGLSLSVDWDGLPSSGGGSIVIDDLFESLGENRRVSDYFDRYTAVNQAVTVYRAIETLGTLTVPSSWTLIYTGKVQSVAKDKESISFSVSNTLVESKIATRTITEDMAATGYEVPEQSLGKSLPLIFSDTDIVVPAYCLDWSETAGNAARYAFCTNLKDTFDVNPASVTCLIKDSDGVYREVSFNDDTVFEYGNLSTGAYLPINHGTSEFVVPIDLKVDTLAANPAPNSVLLGNIGWWCNGQSTAVTSTGQITFTLYRSVADSIDSVVMADWEEITTVDVNKSDYITQVKSGTDFWVNCPFELPIVLGESGIGNSDINYIYAVGIQINNYSGAASDFTSGNVTYNSGTYYYRATKGSAMVPGTGACPCVSISPIAIGVGKNPLLASSTENGLGFTYININPVNNTSCKVSELDVAVITPKGLLDDSSGTITGTPYAELTRPDHVIKMLDYKWNGSAWAASNTLDLSTFSSLYPALTTGSYPRKAIGFTEGDVTWFDLISQIVKEMNCFLVPMTNGKLALWPWGCATGSVVKVFTDADILEYGTIDELDPSDVINSIKIEYGKSFTQVFDQWEASGKSENLSGVLVINKSTSGAWSSLLINSETLYDKRELEESGSQFVGEITTATSRAHYFARRHDHPRKIYTITVPYFDNTTLKLMDVVDLLSVHSPAYFGSTLKARESTYTGTEVSFFDGEYSIQAERKRCQIFGLSNDYGGDFPKLVITLREIKGRHKNDPTAADL